MEHSPLLSLRNINKYYGDLHVLRDVSLDVGRGEIVTIIGASGAGKTTLLQIAGTLDRPDSGEIIYNGQDISRLKDSRLSAFRNGNIGFIFQFHELMPEFTALENVALPAMIGGASKRKATDEARSLLERLGMGHRLQHRPAQLSGGEKQRVAIARALINKPEVIFADEPTGSLDTRNRDEIIAIISDLCSTTGQTFIIVTHDRTLCDIAHRVVEMRDGRIIDQTANTITPETITPETSL